MAQTIDFFVDVTSGELVAAGSKTTGSLPTFTRNDVYLFRVRLQERDTLGFLRDLPTSGTSVKIGVGLVDEGPSDGAFKLVLNATTSSAITYTSDAATLATQILTAVSNNVATVTQFGSEQDSFILTATGTNTALSFGGDSFTLFPTSSILVSTRRNQSANAPASQIIKLRRSPAVFADTFVASSTAGIVSLNLTQQGSSVSNLNETYRLAIGRDAEGGSLVLNFGSNSTTGIAIPSTAVSISQALGAVTGIGANNISVEGANNSAEYIISFVRGLGSTNVTTDLTLDSSGVVYANFLESTVTFATSELDAIFAEEGSDTITPTLEIEVSQGGQPKTVFQGTISVRKDLITTGSAVPAAQASYYTKSEIDAFAFLKNSSTAYSLDATNRTISSPDGNAKVKASNTGLGFFNTTPVGQQSNINVASGLINLGLFASGTTYGVLPLSPRTLTTTASINFGTLAGHATAATNITVTGVALNDIVLIGLPTAVSNGPVVQGVVIATNTVSLTAINGSNSSQSVPTATYRITAIGY
jgi:hypothetical protein